MNKTEFFPMGQWPDAEFQQEAKKAKKRNSKKTQGAPDRTGQTDAAETEGVIYGRIE
jgi:hypothetical protein